jgi:hypothetical protein
MSRTKKAVFVLILVLLPFVLLEIVLRVLGIGGSVIYDESDIYGYRPKPSQEFSTLGHPIAIDENGYRGPIHESDILFVGDSTTYGCAFIASEDTFAAQLQGVNGGVNGWGPANVAAFLKNHDLSSYRLVVWTIPTTDLLQPFMTLREGLISTNRRMLFRIEYLFRFIYYSKIDKQPDFRDPDVLDPNIEAIVSATKHVKNKGVRCLLILLPRIEEMKGEDVAETPYLDHFLEGLDEAGIEIIRLPRMTGDIDSYYSDPVHLSEKGHRWFVEQVKPHIDEALKASGHQSAE